MQRGAENKKYRDKMETEETNTRQKGCQEYTKTGEGQGTNEMIWRRKINNYWFYVVYLTMLAISQFTYLQMARRIVGNEMGRRSEVSNRGAGVEAGNKQS